ncbi:MAG: hypothetical protein JWL57_719 [Actinobacteria bacterium]|nr:hypothetical protein [Actinomycetota bacterium]MEA2566169.1 hypothetical protein [Actinomycetota bacterium]
MGNSTAATLTEIEQTRDRLGRDMAELAERLPAPAIWLKRLAGVAVGGGVGGSLFWFVAHRIRNKSKKGKEGKAAKEAPAAVAQTPVVQVLPPEWGERLGDLFEGGQWKGPAIAIGTVWVLLRWMELRRLKRLTKAMLLAR